jgi:hypothetical protein
MRRKERSGPGIATVVESRAPTLASEDGEALVGGSEGVEPRTSGANDVVIIIIIKAARRAMVPKNGFANGLGDKTVERSVQGLKIASPVRFMDKTT